MRRGGAATLLALQGGKAKANLYQKSALREHPKEEGIAVAYVARLSKWGHPTF